MSRQGRLQRMISDGSVKKILNLNHFLAKYLARYQKLCQNITEKEEGEVEGMREKKHDWKKLSFFFFP